MADLIMHFDLDAFFASVEQQLRPAWRGKPLIVAGKHERSVVAAASYEARAYGIRSAMPTSHARARCRSLIITEPRFEAYRSISSRVTDIARTFTDTIEPISLDEAYLLLKGVSDEEGVSQGRWFRKEVRKELGLSVSVGIARTKLLAKLASDDAKPNGLRLIAAAHSGDYLDAVSIAKIWGVGPSTQAKLAEISVRTVKDLRLEDLSILKKLLGDNMALNLHELCSNIDRRTVMNPGAAKSVSQETTFTADISDPVALKSAAVQLSRQALTKLRLSKTGAKTLNLKLRFGDFRTITRSFTLETLSSSDEIFEKKLLEMLDKIDMSYGLRLIGVSFTNLAPQNQVALFEEPKGLLENLQPVPQASLKEKLYWGMPVTHAVLGDGVVKEMNKDALTVAFNDRERIITNLDLLKAVNA